MASRWAIGRVPFRLLRIPAVAGIQQIGPLVAIGRMAFGLFRIITRGGGDTAHWSTRGDWGNGVWTATNNRGDGDTANWSTRDDWKNGVLAVAHTRCGGDTTTARDRDWPAASTWQEIPR